MYVNDYCLVIGLLAILRIKFKKIMFKTDVCNVTSVTIPNELLFFRIDLYVVCVMNYTLKSGILLPT